MSHLGEVSRLAGRRGQGFVPDSLNDDKLRENKPCQQKGQTLKPCAAQVNCERSQRQPKGSFGLG